MSLSINLNLVSVNLIRGDVDLVTGLSKPKLIKWAPVGINSSTVMPAIAEAAPISNDVVEWMHVAASDVAVFDGMCEDYNRVGSELVSGSGDAYIPGVRVGDLRGDSVNGYTVRSRGYGTVITPAGNFNVPINGKTTFARGDVLAWAAIPNPGTGVQWVLTMLQWRDLAKAPIKDRVRFASSYGLVAPNFFSIPSSILPIRTIKIGLTSDRDQKVVIRGRGVKGSYENVLFEESFNISKGESEVVYNMLRFPNIPSFTLEIQPEDNTQTVLNYIDLIPPI